MLNKARLFVLTTLLVSMLFGIRSVNAQITILDSGAERISTIYNRMPGEFLVDKLEDGSIRMSFRVSDSSGTDLGEVYLSSMEDFEQLYSIIDSGLKNIPKDPIRVDLGNSILRLHFENALFSNALIMVHYYKSAPYDTKRTPILWPKDIRKIFIKSTDREKSDT